MVAGELANEGDVGGIAPWRRQSAGEFVGVGEIEGGCEGRTVAELVLPDDLSDRDDDGLIRREIGERDGTVAGAEVDTETETGVHGSGSWLGAWVEAQSRAVSRAVYFSSTSAGAMAGRWSAEPCRMVGSLTKSVFQP